MAVPNAASGRERFLVALINKAVTEYESGHTDLGQLVNDIESLIDSLEEGSDVSWVNALGHEWLSLEIVNALTLDEGRSELTQGEQNDVDRTIERLKPLLDLGEATSKAHPVGDSDRGRRSG